MTAVEVGRRIRDHRTAQAMSQSALGGGRYSGSYISHLESGRRTPTPDVVNFLATQLGVSPSDIDDSIRPAVAVDVVEAILAVQDQLHSSEWAAAARAAIDAAELAESHGNPDRAWEARYLHAQALFNDGEYADAGDAAELLALDDTVRSAPGLRCLCLVLASRARRASGRSAEAVRHAVNALEVTDVATVSTPVLAQALGALLSASFGVQPAKSAEAAERLRGLTGELSGQSLGVITWQLGVYDFESGRPQEGLTQLMSALTQLSPKADMRLWARLNRVVGDFLVRFDRIDEAADYLAVASSLLRYVGNPSDLIDLHLSQSSLARARGDLAAAESLVALCLADDSITMDAGLRGEAHLLLSHIREDRGDRAGARESVQAAAGAFEEGGVLMKALDAWRRFADLTTN